MKISSFLLFTVVSFSIVGCGSDTIPPNNQTFGDFDEWGSGIEGFSAVPTNPTDTGSTSTGNSAYDGDYQGTYTLSVSYGGNTCTFSNVSVYMSISSGMLASVFEQAAMADCNLTGSSSTYTERLLFDGIINADTTATGTIVEDTGFLFETTWSGFISDQGSSVQLSGSFNQSASSNIYGLVNVSGSFMVTK